jgi:hypothetical protein
VRGCACHAIKNKPARRRGDLLDKRRKLMDVGGLLLGSIPAGALEFLILTAARIDEVRGAKWNGPIPVLMRARPTPSARQLHRAGGR